MRRLLAAITLSLCAWAVLAGPLEDDFAAVQRGNYSAALRLFRPLADQGNAEAQYTLGRMYYNGDGVTQDDGEAAKWWRKAADQGNARAQFGLGLMYDLGLGMPQDYVVAMTWYRKAADQGYISAQSSLGDMYYAGRGVQPD